MVDVLSILKHFIKNHRLAIKRICWSFLFIVLFINIFTFPLLVTVDGNEYLDSALKIEKLYSSPSLWDAFRTPLFPAFIRLFLEIFGFGSFSLIFLNTLFLFFGLLLFAKVLEKWFGAFEVFTAAFFISLHPFIVTYQHSLLSECGSFFFISLITYTLSLNSKTPVLFIFKKKDILFVLSVITAFFYRPSFLYYGLFLICFLYGTGFLSSKFELRKSALTGLRYLTVSLVIFFTANSWSSKINKESRDVRNGVQIMYGLLKQGVVPNNHESLSSLKQIYKDEKTDHCEKTGCLTEMVSEAFLWKDYNFYKIGSAYYKKIFSLYLTVIFYTPFEFIKGCFRILLLYGGFGKGESTLFNEIVFFSSKNVYNEHSNREIYSQVLALNPHPLHFRLYKSFLVHLSSIQYALMKPLYLLFFILTVSAVFSRKIDKRVYYLPILSYFLFGAVTYSSIDRYGFPALPLLLTVSLSLVIKFVFKYLRSLLSRSLGNIRE